MHRANEQPLIHLHWALVVSLIYLLVLGEPGPTVSAAQVVYALALLAGSMLLLRIPFSGPHTLGLALVGFDTVAALAGLALNPATSQDFLIGYFLCIIVASLGDSEGRLAAAAVLVAGSYAIWMVRGRDALHSSPMLLRLPFLFVATVFYGAVMQRVRGEHQHRRVFALTPRPMWVVDAKTGRFLAVNDAAIRDYGYTHDQFMRMSLDDLIADPRSEERSENRTSRVAHAEIVRHRTSDGRSKDVEIFSEPILFDGRECHVAVITDLTEQRRAADDARRSLSLLRSTLEATKEGILVVDRAGRVSVYNQRFLEMWKLAATDLEAHDSEVRLAAVADQLKDPSTFLDKARELYADPDAESFDVLEFKDGRIFERFSRPQKIAGRSVGRVWSFRDVTAERRAEHAARRYTRHYLELFEGIPLGVYRTTPEGVFEDVNAALVELLRYPDRETMRRTKVIDVYANPEDRARLREILDRDGVSRSFEMGVRRFDGSVARVAISARVVRDDEGRVHGYEGIIEDVTDRTRSEEALKEALRKAEESDRLKNAFLANMSHEVRTPLNVILGYNEIIRETLAGTSNTAVDELLDAVRRASLRLINTVHGVLDLARLESGSFEIRPAPLALPEIITEHLRPYESAAAAKGLRLRKAIEVPSVVVRFDEYCFTKSLQHLLDNAVKFAADGEVVVRLFRNTAGDLVLEVRDTGVGISESYMPRLFDPFSQEESGDARPFEGSGVGLAVTKGLLELNGASISVTSQKSKGSVFRIRFDPACEVARVNGSPPGGEPVRPTVLVVEDDVDSQIYVETILGRAYRILKATTGEEVRRELSEHGGEIRCVLMDLALRGNEDGFTITRYIRDCEEWRGLPVIATTAHALQECRVRAYAVGCNAFITKPFTPRQLLSVVDQYIVGT